MDFLLAQSPAEAIEAFSPWLSLGTTATNAVISGLLIWLVTRRMPEQEKEQAQAIAAIVADFREERRLDREERNVDRGQNAKLSETVIAALGRMEVVVGQSIAVMEMVRKDDREGGA